MSSLPDKVSEENHQQTPLHGAQPQPLQGMSLRIKGVWMLLLFLIYTLAVGFVLGVERNILYSDVQKLEAVHAEEGDQFALNMLVTRAILVVNDNYYSADLGTTAGIEAAARSVSVQVEAVLTGLGKVVKSHPELFDSIVALQINLGELTRTSPGKVAGDNPELSGSAAEPQLAPGGLTKSIRPLNREVIADVRTNLHKLVFDLDQVTKRIRGRKQELLEQYRATFSRLSLVWSVTAAIGIVFLGGLVMFFVTRLAVDVRRVQDRALEIVEGYRGQPLKVTRRDELGSLMAAINKMQFELRQNEVQIERIRQQRFHKEKMAAVGSIAAVVAHEINNPLSAIMGAAQAMLEQRAGHGDRRDDHNLSEVIFEQARRVMNITRQISEFSVPQSTERELLDLNNLIRSTVRFISFDRRFSIVDMELNLDPNLPAVRAVGDHITQVIMNLLVNAADAMEGRTDPKPRIAVSTHLQQGHAVVTVTDNGTGMDKNTLARVFEEFFTTKLPGKGSGIGMAVSKSLIESDGGLIGVESEPGVGTTVTVQLPVVTDGVAYGLKEE